MGAKCKRQPSGLCSLLSQERKEKKKKEARRLLFRFALPLHHFSHLYTYFDLFASVTFTYFLASCVIFYMV
jgi:hypothetical protein